MLTLWRRGEDDFSRALPFFGPGLGDLAFIRAEDQKSEGGKTPFRGYPEA